MLGSGLLALHVSYLCEPTPFYGPLKLRHRGRKNYAGLQPAGQAGDRPLVCLSAAEHSPAVCRNKSPYTSRVRMLLDP